MIEKSGLEKEVEKDSTVINMLKETNKLIYYD